MESINCNICYQEIKNKQSERQSFSSSSKCTHNYHDKCIQIFGNKCILCDVNPLQSNKFKLISFNKDLSKIQKYRSFYDENSSFIYQNEDTYFLLLT